MDSDALCSASNATVMPDVWQIKAAAGRDCSVDKGSLTCVSAGRKVTHCTIAVVLQGILVIGLPCLLFLTETPYQVRAAVRFMEPGLPLLALLVPAHP